jgi:hypothetical protein
VSAGWARNRQRTILERQPLARLIVTSLTLNHLVALLLQNAKVARFPEVGLAIQPDVGSGRTFGDQLDTDGYSLPLHLGGCRGAEHDRTTGLALRGLRRASRGE